jgi:hypothetical protein
VIEWFDAPTPALSRQAEIAEYLRAQTAGRSSNMVPRSAFTTRHKATGPRTAVSAAATD